MSDEILLRREGAVANLLFNRPAVRNAATQTMLASLTRHLAALANDPAVRCVVLAGEGEHFMAGGDVKGFLGALEQPPEARREQFDARVKSASATFVQLAATPQPVIAKVRGAAAGAALGFVGGADFVVCGESAVFVLSHVNIGASPDGASSYFLPRVLGVRKAKEIAILGGKLTAVEAKAIGLVTHVVPDAELDAATAQLAARIVNAPARSVQNAKRLMDRSLGHTLEEQLELEAKSFAECASTDDFLEGVRAFVEKRPASFNKDR